MTYSNKFDDVEEIKRLQTLLSYNILDTPPQEEFDGLVKLISLICNSPVAIISLIDDKRQWYKAKIGVSHNEVPRAKILCQYTLQQEDIMEIPDARQDVRVKNNPNVTAEDGIRYYAGVNLKASNGYKIGTLFLLDSKPKELNEEQKQALRLVADQTMILLESRKKNKEMGEELEEIINKKIKETQKQLLQKKTEYILLLHAIGKSNAVVEFSPEGIITSINDNFLKITGYSMDEVIGKHHSIFLDEDESSRNEEFWSSLRNEKFHGGRLKRRHKDGSTVWIQATYSPITDQQKNVIRVIKIAQDITKEIEAEKGLKRSKELAENLNIQKDHFIANMSHELRTPIHAILGFTELLLDEETDRSKKLYIESVKTAGDNLLYIINDILDLSKIGAGIIQLEKQPFNLLFVIKDVFAILHLKAHQKKLLFKFYVDPEVNLHLVGDKNRLTQILINLLGNALKFTSSGSVELYVDPLNFEKETTTLQFRVVDTGIGIPEAKIGAIFDRFSQAEENTSRTFGGTGLGLNISQQLINRQGGDISVESEVGKGSVFSFYLPFVIGKVAPIREKSELAVVPEKTRNANILLCEDNELNQRLIRAILTEKGYSIDLAENGEKGVGLLENKKYDLILMDIQMPIMDGYEATQKIRKEFGSKVPIVALTANFLLAEKAKCLQLGMNDYLSKPFTKIALLNTVDHWISGRTEEKQKKFSVQEPQETKKLSLRILEELSGGSKYFQKEPFNLLSVIKNVFSILHLKAQQKKILFEYYVDPEVNLQIVGDGHRLTQVLINLLGNALKFTSSGGVKLYVDPLNFEKDSTTLQFKVVDTGIGISDEKIDSVFDGFSQPEEDASGTFGCSGLGLNISQQLIKRQGGNISAESEEGKGSIFKFHLTFGVDKVEPIQEKDKPVANPGEIKSNILLCEDNELNQRLIRAILTEKGYNIDLAENGIKGLKLLENNSYDLILMDIQMPLMDGYEATQKIRQVVKSLIPIIALTENFLAAEKTKCLQLGMNDYLSKPLKKLDLLDTVDLWVSRKKVRQQDKSLVEEPLEQEALSLSTLEELSGGNKDFQDDMMGLFILQSKKMYEEIKVFYEANDIEGIKSTAHKLKTSYGIIGADSKLLVDLENALESNLKTTEFQKTLNCLEKQLNEICQILKKLIKAPVTLLSE